MLSPISTGKGGRRYEPGETVELTAAQAARLGDLGCVEPVDSAKTRAKADAEIAAKRAEIEKAAKAESADKGADSAKTRAKS